MWSGELVGYWWLPNQKDQRLPGTLTVVPDEEIRLELLGSFEQIEDMGKVTEYGAVLGVSADGKQLTLCEVQSGASSLSMPGIRTSDYLCRYVISGRHFSDPSDAAFHTISIEYPHLLDWLGKSGFKVELTQTQSNGLERAQYTYEFPETVEASLGHDTVSLDYLFTDSSDYRNRVSLTQRTALKIEVQKPTSFPELWQSYRFHLQTFLALALGIPVKPISVTLHNEDGDGNEAKLDVWMRANTGTVPDKQRHPTEMLFSYGDIEEQFEHALQAWFQKRAELAPVYNLYSAVRYTEDLLLDHELLSISQALEAYHRRMFGGTYVESEEFDSLQENLVGALPNDLDHDVRQAFQARLQYFNEYSLRKRLKQLWDRSEEVVGDFLSDRTSFVDKVVNTRNYLTHYTEELETDKLEPIEMYHLIQRMRFFLEIQLLYELGLEESLIAKLAANYRPYKQMQKV